MANPHVDAQTHGAAHRGRARTVRALATCAGRVLKHTARRVAEQQSALSLRAAASGVFAAALCTAPSATNTEGARVDVSVRIEQRQVVEPADRRLVVPHGSSVRIRWQSDEVGELHVHGYDLRVRLRPDAVVNTRFVARATGRFPVTSHGFGHAAGQVHGHGALFYIEVHPD